MEETADRPKWLLELENRKRKPRLAHEAGAGAPCMVCSTACPGLDLHFWRKICKNCKCSRDDHDFDDDDFPQFDMLFGPSKKFKRKPILLHVNNEKQHESEAAFEWVPPDTTMEVATDYMKALPIEKLPIKGSAGAALRKQLLQKQLPLHDIDHKACDELSEQEKKQFEKYLENIKKYVGQGKVTKILGARPFDRSLMTPANATDMQRFSPQHKPSFPNSTVQLRTPSSFTPKSTYAKNLYEKLNKQDHTVEPETMKNIPILEKYNIVNGYNNSDIAKSEPIKSGIYNQNSYPAGAKLENLRSGGGNKSDSITEEHLNCSNPLATTNVTNSELTPWNHSENFRQGHNEVLRNPTSLAHSSAVNEDAQIAESILADAFLPPSTVHVNDIIGSTLDEKRLMFIREKLTDKYSNQESQVPHNAPNVSRDLDSNDLLRRNPITRNTNLPGNVDKSNERTAIVNAMKNPAGTTSLSENGIKRIENDKVACKPIIAEKDVIKPVSQIVQSIPLDSTLTNNAHKDGLKETLSPAQGIASRSPSRISGTLDRLPQVPIFSNNLSSATPEHPSKLSSSTVPSNVIHSEQLHNQIFPHEAIGMSTQVQNLPNVEHLRGAMEELKLDSVNVKSQKCHNCDEEIQVGDVVVVTEKAKNATWHPGCFVCSMCNELLVDLVYFHYKNKLYCGRDLATLLGIPRCFACDELIFVREYTVAEGHNYHVKHFCCWDCDVPLAGQQYITENDRPLCLPCYQKTYAKTCNGCNKVIAADQQGVAVKNLNFHATEGCFCCHTCKKYLLNGRMAVKEEKLFCSKECISQFLHPQT